jgi:hypothetical protein
MVDVVTDVALVEAVPVPATSTGVVVFPQLNAITATALTLLIVIVSEDENEPTQ